MPKRFHVAHIVHPGPAMHGMHGYREVSEALQWGLNALGYETSLGINRTEDQATNIVLGFQMLAQQSLDQLPDDTIVYNFEQLYGLQPHELKPSFQLAARRFCVWEYSERNLAAWNALGAARLAHVPVAWAPILARIPRAETMDIDVLFYGLPSQERLEIFRGICSSSIRTVFACGLYGTGRDDLISRSKLVLNLNLYESRIFEVVRASYLFANAKAVVSETHPDTFIEADLRDAAMFVAPNMIAGTCKMLLDNEMARTKLETRGEEIFRRRDIRTVLQRALEASLAPA